jgi:hypothetical protein
MPLNLLVPGERIELPTNGLQNRCSTAELTRLANDFSALGIRRGILAPRSIRPGRVVSGALYQTIHAKVK